MDQDVLLGVSTSATQADIPYLREAGRLGEYAVVYRVTRTQQGGGFGDQSKHPYAWAVLVYVDTLVARINSARGTGREWNSLDRLERWLRENGFWYWWTRNDLELLGDAVVDPDSDILTTLPESFSSPPSTLASSADPSGLPRIYDLDEPGDT